MIAKKNLPSTDNVMKNPCGCVRQKIRCKVRRNTESPIWLNESGITAKSLFFNNIMWQIRSTLPQKNGDLCKCYENFFELRSETTRLCYFEAPSLTVTNGHITPLLPLTALCAPCTTILMKYSSPESQGNVLSSYETYRWSNKRGCGGPICCPIDRWHIFAPHQMAFWPIERS
jgi:hypothetical protein